MSDGLTYVSQENAPYYDIDDDIQYSEQNTEIALLNYEVFQDAEYDDEAVESDFLYASQYAANSNMPKSILRAEGLNKSFHKKQAVRDVSFSMAQGEVVGLLGPNGAGKTTSFYMIVGLVAADHGTIRLDGHELRHMTVYQRARLGLGYLPQEASIFRKMTVEENIRAILQLHETDRHTIESRLNDLLADLNITHLRQSPAPALSGGERRRVEIARVLAMSPRFILLDEPFAGVDPIAVIDIQNIINFLKQRGIGVLITDHNVRETLRICDRAYIINNGAVLASGRPEELVGNEEVRAVYLGENFDY